MKALANIRELNALTYKINGLAMRVHQELGMGCLEVVYKDALEHELRLASISYEREKEYPVLYRGIVLKHKFYADFIVEDCVVVEAKAQRGIAAKNNQQSINYLAISKCQVCLLLNFGEPKLQIKRVVLGLNEDT